MKNKICFIVFLNFTFIAIANGSNDSEILVANDCVEAMFDAMDWAAEACLDDQTIADAGNNAYAECWLMHRNLKIDSGQ